jgi:hypothetical protein
MQKAVARLCRESEMPIVVRIAGTAKLGGSEGALA